MNLDEMSKDQLELLQIATEERYQVAVHNTAVARIADNQCGLRAAKITVERKELADAIIKGAEIEKSTMSELRNIKSMIYRKLQGL